MICTYNAFRLACPGILQGCCHCLHEDVNLKVKAGSPGRRPDSPWR